LLTKNLFSEKGYLVKNTNLIKREIYSGKEIRKRIQLDKPWDELVPDVVNKIIKEINGASRIKNLSE